MNHDITPERLYKLLCGVYPPEVAKELIDEITEDRELVRDLIEEGTEEWEQQ